MDKKNIVEGDLITNGYTHIGDNINNYYINEIIDKATISKSQYRLICRTKPFDINEKYIKRSYSSLSEMQERRRFYDPINECKPLIELLNERKKIVLLGDAGLGKSTELKWLYNELLASEQNVFPIWVSLNNHIPDGTLDMYFYDLELIPSGNIVCIMDGYDELGASDHPKFIRQIANLLETKNEIKILISSRKNTYDIVGEKSNPSLPNFEIYYLNELTPKEIENYFETFDTAASYKIFSQELERVRFSDIIRNPFYLKLVINIFLSKNGLPDSKSELMNECINSMMLLDDKRNKNIDIIDTYQLRKTIERVALTMELLCKNTITDEHLREVIERNDYKILKYFGGYKKEDGKNDIWKFDHNNFQEYLAAKAISQSSFEDILKCISFEPNFDRLNPSWMNTIGYLFSEIDDANTFQNLVSWLVKYNKEFLVGAESNKINSEVRFEVFKSIFNEYERDDLFLYSNYFTYEKLIDFAGDQEIIFEFLMDKFKTSNGVKVKTNALRLLGYLNYTINKPLFTELYDVCFHSICNQKELLNGLLLEETVRCLVNVRVLSEVQIEEIYKRISQETFDGIINATLKLINQSSDVDKFVNYLVEAYKIKIHSIVTDIGINSIIEENLSRISSKEGIRKVFEFLDSINWNINRRKSLVYLDGIISNAIELYKSDNTIFNTILYTIKNPILLWMNNFQSRILRFFNETNTREKAFSELWELKKNGQCNRNMIALLVSTNTINHLIPEIEADTSFDGDNWLSTIHNSSNDQKEILNQIIFKDRKSIDEGSKYILLESEYNQSSFDQLFDPGSFKMEANRIINSINKTIIESEDVNLLISENYRGLKKFSIPASIISLFQELLYQKESIPTSQIIDFIEDNIRLQNYRIIKIHEMIQGRSNLNISKDQIQIIENWVRDILSRYTFSEIHFRLKHCIADFSVRFDFSFTEDILIQFIPFENFLCYNTTCFLWLKTKLSHRVMLQQITEILKSDKNLSQSVFLNFYKYLNENNVKNISHHILDSIINKSFDQGHRISFINEYLNCKDSNIKQLIAIYDDTDVDIKWHLIGKFIEHGEQKLVEEILKKYLSTENQNPQDRIYAIENLAMMEDQLGFDLYLKELCNFSGEKLEHYKLFKNFKKQESIAFLFTLLEFYIKTQNHRDLENDSTSDVIACIEIIALISFDNYHRIMKEYYNLMEILPNERPYLVSLTAGLTDRFYRNKAGNRTISDVKLILKSLDLNN